MANIYFEFRQFTIRQDRCAMKVGTDGVLLGAWARVERASRILDVGTGTGLIAIMAAQRSKAIIDAVEIDAEAWSQAVENVAACPWSGRINLYRDSFQHFANQAPATYDVIVSNPPYFRNSLKPTATSRSVARHDDRLNLESLLHYAAFLLSARGRFAVIIPATDLDRLIAIAAFNRLYPSQVITVLPLPGKKASRCMVEFSADRTQSCETVQLVVRNRDSHSYTDAYRHLTGDFYL